MTLSQAQTDKCLAIGYMYFSNNKLKMILEKTWYRPNLCNIPEFAWRAWIMPRNSPVEIAGVPIEIQTRSHSNKNQIVTSWLHPWRNIESVCSNYRCTFTLQHKFEIGRRVMTMSPFCIEQQEIFCVMQRNRPVSSPAVSCGPSGEHLRVLSNLLPALALPHGSNSFYSDVQVAICK
jgi:hypothetical protein